MCIVCRETGARFACGKVRSSNYRCDVCQLAFCRVSVSDCFYQWHKRLDGIDLSTMSSVQLKWRRLFALLQNSMRSRHIYNKRKVCMCCKLSAGNFGVLRKSYQTMKTSTILESLIINVHWMWFYIRILKCFHISVSTNVEAYPRGRQRQSKFEAIKEVTNENTLVYHQLVPHPGYMKKTCAYCRDHGVRFASGCPKTSYYRCDLCQVALCRPSVSDCFINWHKERKEGKSYLTPF